MPDDPQPLSPQPDSSIISPDQLGALQHASRWAGTFGGQDTNIAERSRHNQDIADYATGLAQTRAAAQQQLIQTNQTAQNLWLNTQRLQMQEEQHQMHMAVSAAQLAATGATERRKAAEALAQANDTTAFNQHVSDLITSGVKPQTPEWQAGIADGLAQFSHANPVDVSKYGAQLFPGQKMTPDEYISKAVALKTAAVANGFKNPRLGEFQGNPTVVEGAPDKTVDHIAQLQDQLAASTPVYGAGDGSSFAPVATGQGAQTHVQATYISPQGKAVTQVFPRPFFDSMVSASKARQSSTPVATQPEEQSAPASFDTPDAFTSAFKSAPSGAVIHYQGKPYKKP